MAGEDPDYLERVASLTCCAAGLSPCNGPIQAHHAVYGRVSRAPAKGGDRRAHDHDAIPLCMAHHDAFHGSRHPFKILVKAEKAGWEGEMVLRTQRMLRPMRDHFRRTGPLPEAPATNAPASLRPFRAHEDE